MLVPPGIEYEKKDNVKVLISEKELQEKISLLGEQISRDYEGRIPVLISVLKGSFIFIADLCRKISIPVVFDFMAVSSYGNSMASSGVVRITKDLDYNIQGRDVLIVEDIIDSGRTLHYLVKNIEAIFKIFIRTYKINFIPGNNKKINHRFFYLFFLLKEPFRHFH